MPGGGWNYRIIKTTYEHEVIFDIREVYYTPDDFPKEFVGKPFMVTTERVGARGNTMEELKGDHEMQKQAFDRTVIDAEYFESEECKELNRMDDNTTENHPEAQC